MTENDAAARPRVAFVESSDGALASYAISDDLAARFGFSTVVQREAVLNLTAETGNVMVMAIDAPMPSNQPLRDGVHAARSSSHYIVTSLARVDTPSSALDQARNLLASCALIASQVNATRVTLPYRDGVTISATQFVNILEANPTPAALLVTLVKSETPNGTAIRTHGMDELGLSDLMVLRRGMDGDACVRILMTVADYVLSMGHNPGRGDKLSIEDVAELSITEQPGAFGTNVLEVRIDRLFA